MKHLHRWLFDPIWKPSLVTPYCFTTRFDIVCKWVNAFLTLGIVAFLVAEVVL